MRYKTLIFIIVALAANIALYKSSSQADDEPIIREILIIGEGPQHAEQIKRIIPFREGSAYSVADAARTASLLKKTGLYGSIRITTENVADGVKVIIELEPQRFIKQVRFRGGFPLFESELRKAVATKEGAPYDPDKVEGDVERLEAFLRKLGYFDARVDTAVEADKKTGDVIVLFTIKKGHSYNLFKVIVKGNENLTSETIGLIIRRRVLFKFGKEKLDKGVQSVVHTYNLMGYYEARVSVENVELDADYYGVIVSLRVKEGRKAKIVINGNHSISNQKLVNAMTLAEEKSIDEFDISDSAEKMTELYKSKGYRKIQIGWETRQEPDATGEKITVIEFTINEGPKVKVAGVKFRGIKAFDKGKLKKQIVTGRRRGLFGAPFLVDKVLNDDLSALQAFYGNWGYEEAEVGTPEIRVRNKKGSKVKVIIPIVEGDQTAVGDVWFEGMEFFEADFAMSRLKLVQGAPFDPALLEEDKKRLLLLYADYGFPYAKVAQKMERAPAGNGEKWVEIKYTVQEGRRVLIGETVIRGNYETKGRVLMREVELHPGEPFSYSGLLQSRSNLRALAFLYSSRLETIGLEENMDVAHLLLDVHERPVRTADFGVGYDSDLGPNAWLELGDRNLFGLGKTGKLKLMGLGDMSSLEAQYSDPRFFGTRIRADAVLSATYEDLPAYDLTQLAAKFSLTKILTTHITGTLASRTEWNRLSDVIKDASFDITVEENTLIGVGPVIVYDTRDDFIDPSRGWHARLSIEYIDEFVHANTLIKSEGLASYFISVASKVVLATTLNVGHIELLDNSEAPLQEVFFTGGNRSVRGYSEDGLGPRSSEGGPTGGLDKIVASVEIRYPIYKFVHGVVFCDSGQLAPDVGSLSASEQVYSVGTGLRFLTPVGPVRLDWGYKLEPVWWESRDRWHFSFGYPF